jgi:DUF1009 family protein
MIAGAGRLPLEFIDRARKKNQPISAVLIRGAASPTLEKKVRESLWVSIGQLGKLVSFFKKRGVRQAVMLGKVQHASALKDPRLDWRAIRLLARLKDRSGESILKGIGDELRKDGVLLLDSRHGLEHLLARSNESVLRPDPKTRSSVEWGLRKARVLAREAVGQTILVKRKAVVAVEGAEGTDEAILRAGKWAGKGTILLKVSSPRQDWRFDVPTVGPKTILALARTKADGLVVEAGRTFILEKEKTFALAKKNGLFLRII